MSNNNDSRVLELKKQIEEKRKKVNRSEKFNPVTNCSIDINGTRVNIQTLGKEQIVSLLVQLNSYALAAKDLELLSEYSISGYNVQDWIVDLKAKLEHLSRKEEIQKLKAMEAKLDQLLSNEKKVELELNEIASLLKGEV